MALGDTDATAAFVRRFQPRVYGLALSVVADPCLAEEVTQDAFVRAWRHAGTYDPDRGRVATWLLTITRNLAVDAIRLRRDLPVDPWRLPSPTTDPDPSSRVERIQEEILALPASQSRPVVLSILYGLTAQEIAEREGIPLGTAKTRIRRGLARIRTALATSS
ncbi:RNA polymerase sigma factor [Nonomuraea typhae]|uniref:RNA polymerase sigma factor n=1 Tax=Nonomuraea typhae TaxID=2603600 RepID=UPI0012F7F183|nr:sigma-70 family RNA polymerase sigma factor [Nonomuraea typhae]